MNFIMMPTDIISSFVCACRGRGWARLGAAQLCAGHPTASVSAYAKGLQMDPKNEEMTVGMELAKREIERRDQNNRRAATHDS